MILEFPAEDVHVLVPEDDKMVQTFLLNRLNESLDEGNRILGNRSVSVINRGVCLHSGVACCDNDDVTRHTSGELAYRTHSGASTESQFEA